MLGDAGDEAGALRRVVGRGGKEEVPNQRMRGRRGKNILRTEAVSRRSWGRRGRANTQAQ